MAVSRILDLDLDFFLDPFTEMSRSPRQSDDKFTPWKECAVREFLEQNCRLDWKRPIPGRVVETHDAAFDWWKELIESNSIQTPFEVVHVDAHADLGCGDACFNYVHRELLLLPAEERTTPKTGFGGINEGNFLTFALACRWLGRVDFVYNRDTVLDEQFPSWAFKDSDINTNEIQLKQLPPFPQGSFLFEADFSVQAVEPEIPCGLHVEMEYQSNSDFDYLLLAKSPTYTPPASDTLIGVIQEYISES